MVSSRCCYAPALNAAAAPGRREPADGGSAPPGPSAALRACRAQGRRTRSGRSCRAVTLKEMKTLRAHGFSQRPRFEQVVGYLERNEPLPWTSRTARTFVTSHFYLDDFVQSSEDPNPQPLQHTPLRAIPEEGFRTPAKATDDLAIEETAAAAAEEGEVAVAAEGVGGAFGYLGGLAEGAACHGGSWRSGNGRVGRGTRRRRSLRPGPRHGLGAGEHALPASAGQRGRGRAGRPVRQQHERRHAAPALHAALRQQHLRQPRKQPGADQSHAAPLLLKPEPCDSAPVPAELPGKLPQLRTPEPPGFAELQPAGPRYRGGLDSPSPYKRK